MNALKLYEDLKNINLVAQALNTSPEIVKSNYLNYSYEWARNRFKVLGYDKKKIAQKFNEVEKQCFYKKLKTTMKSFNERLKKSYLLILISIKTKNSFFWSFFMPITKPKYTFIFQIFESQQLRN